MNKKFLQPIIYALLISVGVLIGRMMGPQQISIPFLPMLKSGALLKMTEAFNYLRKNYVDTVNEKSLAEDAINGMLQKLDPHSFYIPVEELRSVNESLEGNFEGIGVEFNIYLDTIVVVSPISGGPSEQLGIKSGDRIVKIEGINVAGIGITNKDVISKLRGASATIVNVSILRKGNTALIPFAITRGKIPIFSVDAAYMVDKTTGYIKINRFAETTMEEYHLAFDKLKDEGLKNLILDLRNNPGGYLQAATLLADEFLDEDKLIVYTEGRTHPKKSYFSTKSGEFEKGKLVVLIDEGSASASEIVSGAVQDWDRGTIIGRRSFGKGLVQDQRDLSDSSAIRLTIARYYTPSGRCIQKPYDKGKEKYFHELEGRVESGELKNADSIPHADSLKYKTKIKGRIVYGGGGIMPDVFVPIDTSMNSLFLAMTLNNGLLNRFVFDFTDKNRQLNKKYKSADDFRRNFAVSDEMYNSLVVFVEKQTKSSDKNGAKTSSAYLKNLMKALIARVYWKGEGYYSVQNNEDITFRKAVEEIEKKSDN